VRALISGAGIGGLATGIALRKAGLEIQVFERSRELREIGAGLMIWPNGTRALQALGVEVDTMTVQKLSLVTWRGRLLLEAPIAAISERFGSEISFVHRADLQAALSMALGKDALRLGSDVTGYAEEEDQVQVKLQDGSVASGDFLVGADGLRSVIRGQLLQDGEPVYLGSTVWRGIVASEGIPIQRGYGVNWVGRGSEFLAFHLSNHRIYWACVTKEAPGEKSGAGGNRQDVMDRFASWAAPIPTLIAATPEAAILRNDMYDRPPARRWSLGRVTLVGDAAHPMTPNQGQGACQALEDAVALGESLEHGSDLSEAFELYEKRRLKRANLVVRLSRQQTRGTQIDNPLLCALRDGFSSVLPRRLMLRMLDATLAAQPTYDRIRGTSTS
jgi:2-polyprenyl-6-methoxyphenol hydroxylase-like FAD-dependent oxidoreductase